MMPKCSVQKVSHYRWLPTVMPSHIALLLDAAISELRATGAAQQIEYDLEIPDGIKSYSAKVSMKKDAYGKFEGVTAVVRDVTEQKRAQEALKESEEKYRNVVERANDVIVVIQDEVVKYANVLASVMIGYTPEEAIGQSLIKFVHPEEMPKALDRYKRRMAGEDVPSIYETALQHKNGHRIEVELSGGIISYEGRPADMIIVRDITERKQAEEALRGSEEKLRSILESSPDAITVTNLEAKLTDCNAATLSMHGFDTVEELIGMDALELLLRQLNSISW